MRHTTFFFNSINKMSEENKSGQKKDPCV